jgi:hypothetical protein
MTPARRNIVALVATSGLLYVLWRYSGMVASAPMFLLVLFVLAWGFGVYFAFDTSPALRVVLSTVTPIIAGVAFELTAHDDGYQYLVLLICGVMALLAFMGSVLGSIIHQWRKRRSNEIVA